MMNVQDAQNHKESQARIFLVAQEAQEKNDLTPLATYFAERLCITFKQLEFRCDIFALMKKLVPEIASFSGLINSTSNEKIKNFLEKQKVEQAKNLFVKKNSLFMDFLTYFFNDLCEQKKYNLNDFFQKIAISIEKEYAKQIDTLQNHLSLAIGLSLKELGLTCDVISLSARLFPKVAKLYEFPLIHSKKEEAVFIQVEEMIKLTHSPTLQLVSDYWEREDNQKNHDFKLFAQVVSEKVKGFLYQR